MTENRIPDSPFLSHIATSQSALSLSIDGEHCLVSQSGQILLAGEISSDLIRIEERWRDAPAAAVRALLEMSLSGYGAVQSLRVMAPAAIAASLAQDYGAMPEGQILRIYAESLFQDQRLWMAAADQPAFPLRYVMSGAYRHPLRAPKPTGTVYARMIPWLGGVFSLRSVGGEDDIATLHQWMNDPRVDAFWNEAGPIEKHRAYLAVLAADTHMLPLFGCLDGRPFCYFELYWSKESRIAPYYDAADWDRGWHVLVGDDRCRGRDWVTAWLPSLMHYIFLDDPRTQRIVGEPRIDHLRQLRNLDHAGFARLKHIDLPHKRAVLVRLERERFFADRLWAPAVGWPA